jgi:hypothetical protein
MTIKRADMASWANHGSNLLPAVIVKGDINAVAARFSAEIETGIDSLDEFIAVPLTLCKRADQPQSFALWRHKGNPAGTFSILLPLSLKNPDAVIACILRDLDIAVADVIWRQGAESSAQTHEAPASKASAGKPKVVQLRRGGMSPAEAHAAWSRRAG